ncbi:MAG: ATP-binding protein [Thermoleophilia bacterium]|nr:ATP-binding protein [Thermoleophilia bacterium]
MGTLPPVTDPDPDPVRARARRRMKPVSVGWAVARFAIASLAAIAVVVVGGYFALRSVAVSEAQGDTRLRVQELGQLVESSLDDGILRADPESLAALDEVVVTRILTGSVVRVKLWSDDGRILYSDEPALIGRRFGLSEDQQVILREGGANAELTDLSRPENVLDRGQGDLLEAHTVIRTPSGRRVIFEIYEPLESATSSGEDLLRALAPPILGGLAVILLALVPLAWSMARSLRRGYEERETLLANAVAASDRERRRIASHLHDGTVQEIAGVAFGLAPLADRAAARGAEEEAAILRSAMERLRHSVRDLRTLLVELSPPHLEAAGLRAALDDLVSPLQEDGVQATVEVRDGARLGPDQQALVYRVAQEAVRNVAAHSGARHLTVAVGADGENARLVVADDGRGFAPAARARRGEEGHVGLTLLEELVAQAGGRLDIRSAPGEGTRVELEVPPG